MSLDLSAANDAGARALFESENRDAGNRWEMDFEARYSYREYVFVTVTAAAAIIEAAVRAQIAAEIEAFFPDPHPAEADCQDCYAFREAARIVRGESR